MNTQAQAHESLRTELDRLTLAGAPPPEVLAVIALAEKHALSFDLLTDAGGRVARDWRLRYELPIDLRQLYLNAFQVDLRASNVEGEWSLPVPGTFVLDSDGVVRARHVAVDYTTRMEPGEIVETLATLPARP